MKFVNWSKEALIRVIKSFRTYVLIVGLVGALITGIYASKQTHSFQQNLLTNLCASLITITITVVIIDGVNKHRDRRRYVGAARDAYYDMMNVLDDLISVSCSYFIDDRGQVEDKVNENKKVKALRAKVPTGSNKFEDYSDSFELEMEVRRDEKAKVLNKITENDIKEKTYEDSEVIFERTFRAKKDVENILMSRGYSLNPEVRELYLRVGQSLEGWQRLYVLNKADVKSIVTGIPNKPTGKLKSSMPKNIVSFFKSITDYRTKVVKAGYR